MHRPFPLPLPGGGFGAPTSTPPRVVSVVGPMLAVMVCPLIADRRFPLCFWRRNGRRSPTVVVILMRVRMRRDVCWFLLRQCEDELQTLGR